MLTLDFENLILEFKEGTVKHVGASNTAATVKLYDVTAPEAREFGDRVKLAFADDEGNTVEVALDPADATDLAGALSRLGSQSENER